MPDEPQQSFQEFVDRSLSRPGSANFFEATGIRIHYLEWAGPPGAPTLLLLHGFLGNAHWWDFIAPWLAEDYRVVAADFGGMGDSGYRTEYRYENFVAEVAAVIEHARLAPCTLIGHSFGGRTLLFACAQFAPLIRHAIVVDSRLASQDDPFRQHVEIGRQKKRYRSIEEMLPRFRLQPEERVPTATRLHIARESLRAEGDAFVWKFDEQVTQLFRSRDASDLEDQSSRLIDLPMPVDLICGEYSQICTRERARRLVAGIRSARGPIVIPTASHHIPIGQPLALLAALRGVLALAARSRK